MTRLIHMILGGPTRKILVRGKVFTFEDHPQIGPVVLKRNGDPAKSQPLYFLEAASLWYQQGKRVGKDGMCIWTPPESFG